MRPNNFLMIYGGNQNLLSFSQDFTQSVWSKNAAIISPDVAIAPDGSMTASKMVAAATSAFHYGRRNPPVVVHPLTTYTYSIFAKAGEYTTCFINFPSDAILTTFNLSTGAVIIAGAGVSAKTESVGNGWYRLICTYTTVAQIGIVTFFGLQTSSFLGNGTSGVFIWGAQLNLGDVARPYQVTGERPIF